MMFAESGMEVYETVSTVWIDEDNALDSKHTAERTSSMIRVRACMEQLQQQLYSIHELMDQLDLEDTVRSERIEGWVNHVQTTIGSLTNVRAEDVVIRNRPWEL